MLKQRALLVPALAVLHAATQAAGLGAGVNAGALGQTLDFSVPVTLAPGEQLAAGCMMAEVLLGDRRLPATQWMLQVEALTAESARVRLVTTVPVDEPVVAVQLTLQCGNTVSRRYVLLIDPPASQPGWSERVDPAPAPAPVAPLALSAPTAPTAPTAAGLSLAPRAAPGQTGGVAAAGAGGLRLALNAPVAGAVRTPARPQVDVPQKSADAAAAARPRRQPPAADRQPRLRLDAPAPTPAAGPAVAQAALASAASAASAQADSATTAAAVAAADRMMALERTVEQLRTDARQHNEQVARLREALAHTEEPSHIAQWLALAAVLLLGLSGWLMVRLAALRRLQAAAWHGEDDVLKPPAAAAGEAVSADDDTPLTLPATAAMTVPPPEETLLDLEVRQAAVPRAPDSYEWGPPTLAADRLPRPGGSLPPGGPQTAAQEGSGVDGAGDVSIDELLDLEQQAEFFIALDQDDAAIDLLVEHLRNTGGGSPLPYLKLLEIHRRRGDHNDYERIRLRFNQRFNAFAPAWELDLHGGRSLQDYAGVLPRLAGVWSQPLEAMAELESLMFRKASSELFDLPAYREVLFLYAVARDLLDRESAGSGSVDLLLPLLSDPADFSRTAAVSFLESGPDELPGVPEFEDQLTLPVDLDLSFDGERISSIFDPLQDAHPPQRPR
jgi:hypothetical protein